MVIDLSCSAQRRRNRLSNSAKIFVVEDEVLVAFQMADVLEDLGFEVIGPSVHIQEAKDTARKEEISAAILDVNLGPRADSEPVANILRKRGIPFVFVTAYDPEQIEFRTSDDRVLKKPITSREIYEALKEVLPERKLPE